MGSGGCYDQSLAQDAGELIVHVFFRRRSRPKRPLERDGGGHRAVLRLLGEDAQSLVSQRISWSPVILPFCHLPLLMRGGVRVGEGATFILGSEEGADTGTIRGGIRANAPASLQVHFAHINGGVRMLGGNGEFSTVEDNVIHGGATINGYSGFWFRLHPQHGPRHRHAQQQRYGRPGRERVCDEHDRRQSRLS